MTYVVLPVTSSFPYLSSDVKCRECDGILSLPFSVLEIKLSSISMACGKRVAHS